MDFTTIIIVGLAIQETETADTAAAAAAAAFVSIAVSKKGFEAAIMILAISQNLNKSKTTEGGRDALRATEIRSTMEVLTTSIV